MSFAPGNPAPIQVIERKQDLNLENICCKLCPGLHERKLRIPRNGDISLVKFRCFFFGEVMKFCPKKAGVKFCDMRIKIEKISLHRIRFFFSFS